MLVQLLAEPLNPESKEIMDLKMKVIDEVMPEILKRSSTSRVEEPM